ncbi:MAG TPA: endonuclease/exonuclease/phosphatase family protein, partial [Lacipirellulaceae bacterium]|nr:endonuclease/exonuclease/phosphatase family protein [Lacipirellulaceae bacterium]
SYGKPQEEASENDWTDPEHPRRERAIRVIRESLPDILGVQEARHLQIEDLQSALREFDFYGIGRDDGKTEGEYSGIFYLKDRFRELDAGSFWLSATPEKPGTTFYTAPDAVPRIASWVRLADSKSGREIFVLNMHWDHISVPAREQSAQLVRRRLTDLAEGLPAIVMGDLNAPEDSKAVTELVGAKGATGRRLVDSFRAVHPERTREESTFSAWSGRTAGSRIDFILHTDEFTPTAASIVRSSYDGHWPSDHYPVAATLRLDTRD